MFTTSSKQFAWFSSKGRTDNSQSFRIYMFSNNADLKTNNDKNCTKPFLLFRAREWLQ